MGDGRVSPEQLERARSRGIETVPKEPPRAGADGGPLGHSHAARYERDQRRIQVSALYAAHTPIRQIARMLNVAPATIRHDVDVIRRYWHARAAIPYGKRMAEELAKLDELERTFLPKARAGDIAAAMQVQWILKARAGYLGLEAPRRSVLEVITEDVLDAEIRKLEEQLERIDKDA